MDDNWNDRNQKRISRKVRQARQGKQSHSLACALTRLPLGLPAAGVSADPVGDG